MVDLNLDQKFSRISRELKLDQMVGFIFSW